VTGASAGAEEILLARSLGARGSRAPVGHDDPAGDPGEDARAVLAAIPAWWEVAAQTAGLSGRWLDVEAAIDGLDPASAHAAPAEVDELTGWEVGALYVAALSPGDRSRHGRHYTPVDLAERLWSMARLALGQRRPRLPLPGLVRDPACGGGALLLPPLRQHLSALAGADPRVTLAGLPRLIEGVDADPAATWIANVVLAAELLPFLFWRESPRRAVVHFRCLPMSATDSRRLRDPLGR